jgi:hypothetical protein
LRYTRYSFLNNFTGLALATRNAWQEAIARAKSNERIPVNGNTGNVNAVGFIPTLFYLRRQFFRQYLFYLKHNARKKAVN